MEIASKTLTSRKIGESLCSMGMFVGWRSRFRLGLSEEIRNKAWAIHHLVFLTLQLASASYWLYLWYHLPLPGKAVAVLAFVAAAMSLHVKMNQWQRAIWMVIIGGYLLVEFKAISTDRAANDAVQNGVRDQQNQKFDAIASGLKTAIELSERESTATIDQIRDVLQKTEAVAVITSRSLLNITGGESYAYVYPAVNRLVPEMLLSIHNGGDQSLTGVEVTIRLVNNEPETPSGPFGMEGWPAVSMGSIASNEGRTIPPPAGLITPRLHNGSAHYRIFIAAQNRGTTEDLYFRPALNGPGLAYRFDAYKVVVSAHRKGDKLEDGDWIRYLKQQGWTEPK